MGVTSKQYVQVIFKSDNERQSETVSSSSLGEADLVVACFFVIADGSRHQRAAAAGSGGASGSNRRYWAHRNFTLLRSMGSDDSLHKESARPYTELFSMPFR